MKKRLVILLVCVMISAMLLQGFPDGLEATAYPTSTGMMEFALKAWRSGWGYVYGTYGQNITQSVVDGKRSQYPGAFSEIMSDGRTAYQHALEWIGVRAADCAGLLKAYLWWQDDTLGIKYVGTQDQSANTIYNSAAVKGDISTIPNTHGVLVWRSGHIGVYIGNGEVIEARGVEYGVVKTRLSDRNWTNWCRYSFLTYPTTGWITIDNQTYYYRNGAYVTGLQTIDGKTWLFGPDGIRQTGFQMVDGQLRYFTGEGSLLTGWQTLDGSRYFFDTQGNAATGWKTIDGKRYRFSNEGVLLEGWQQIEDAVYFLSGGSPVSGATTVQNRSLAFDMEGRLLTGWQQTGTGWQLRDGTGSVLTGLQAVGDQVYLLNTEGIRQGGWHTVDGRAFYFDPSTGERLAGGLRTIEGRPVILLPDGARPAEKQLVWHDGKVYLCDATGQPLSGPQSLSAFASAGDPAVPVSLAFNTTNFTLEMANQTVFGLSAPSAVLTLAATQQTVQLTASGTPPAEPRWMSLNPSVATVDSNGLVTAIGAGQTLILLSGAEGTYAISSLSVLPKVTDLSLTQQTVIVEPGHATLLPVKNLPASLLPFYRLTSSDPAAVSLLSDGRQIVHQSKDAVISLWLGETKLLSWTVRGQNPLIGIGLSRSELVLPVGGHYDRLAALVPQSGTRQTLAFTSSQPGVATIDANGHVKALTAGTTILTAQCGNETVTCNLTVKGQYPLLKRGSTGEPVLQLQKSLADRGYLAGPADGQFGPLTEFAVTALQRKMNLSLTGQADHALQVILQDGLAPAATALKTAGSLSSGDTGEQVFAMQMRLYELNFLKSKPGGNFGPLTLQAVKTLQVLNSLPATGTAAVSELSLLYSASVKAGQAVLSLNDTGYEVQVLQERLAALNYYAGPIDGVYSAAVETAIRQFQTQYGLTVDGEAGFVTQSKVFASSTPPLSEGSEPMPSPAPPAPSPTPSAPPPAPTPAPQPATPTELLQGSQGDAVTALETRLVDLGYHLDLANSIYDGLTAASVRSFQQRAGLGLTGVADLTTQQRLAASTAPRSTQSYRYGSTGDGVRRVQLRLIALGHLRGTADGKFGSMTLAAAKSYQRSAGLTVDGIIGSRTLARLFYSPTGASMPVSPSPTTPSPTPDPTVTQPTTLTAPRLTTSLRKGSRGENVRLVQLRLIELGYLRGSADGIFGSMTDAAVRAFQRRAGLTVDGIVGSRTIARLFDSSAPRAG